MVFSFLSELFLILIREKSYWPSRTNKKNIFSLTMKLGGMLNEYQALNQTLESFTNN